MSESLKVLQGGVLVGALDKGDSEPFYEGLLPEGDVREAVARQFHVSAMRPMELIRVLGKDCAGDVVILEEGDSCDLPGEAAYVPLPNTLEEIVRYPYGAIAQLRAEYRLSLAGGQEKIALFHDDRAPLDKGWFAPLAGSTRKTSAKLSASLRGRSTRSRKPIMLRICASRSEWLRRFLRNWPVRWKRHSRRPLSSRRGLAWPMTPTI